MLDLKKIGEQLITLRSEAGLSQEKLAEKLYVSHQAVSRWETGKSLPTIDTLIALTLLFNTSIDTLLCLNCDLEKDLEQLFKNHSRLFIIDHILTQKISQYQIEDILHILSQDERYYMISKILNEKIYFSIESLWPRLSFEERRMIIMHYLEHKRPKSLTQIWDMLAPFEKNLIMKER